MKKIFSLLVLCATVVFASCSKDDPVTDPVPEGIVVTTYDALLNALQTGGTSADAPTLITLGGNITIPAGGDYDTPPMNGSGHFKIDGGHHTLTWDNTASNRHLLGNFSPDAGAVYIELTNINLDRQDMNAAVCVYNGKITLGKDVALSGQDDNMILANGEKAELELGDGCELSYETGSSPCCVSVWYGATLVLNGGKTAAGIEVAGILSEMKKFVLPNDYPDMPSSLMNIYLIEAGPRLLAGMSEESSAHAEQFLREMGVNILLNKRVVDYRDHKVVLEDGTEIATRTFIWVSGVTGVTIGNLDASLIGRGGRIKVDSFNRVEGMNNVFAIGDQCIQLADENYPNGHPQLAQVAIQQGELLAKNLIRMEKGQEMKPFHYRNLGSMATVGRNRAVAEFSKVKMQIGRASCRERV